MNNFDNMTGQERLNTPVAEMGRVDIRGYIKRRIKEEGLTQYKMAQLLGVERTNFDAALRGAIPMPLDRIETLLWLLDGDASPLHG